MSRSLAPLDRLPVTGIVAFTQTALGFGVGLLVAGNMRKNVQRTAALAVLTVGLAATVPLVVDLVGRLLGGPQSARGMRRRLASIRDDSGLSEDAEML
jgi:ABC-type amino acid transport system permease subunit